MPKPVLNSLSEPIKAGVLWSGKGCGISAHERYKLTGNGIEDLPEFLFKHTGLEAIKPGCGRNDERHDHND